MALPGTNQNPAFHSAPSLCIACGYQLQGLAPEGRCPECGEKYEPSQLVLFGVPRSLRGVSLWRRAAWVGVIVLGAFSVQILIALLMYHWIAAAAFALVMLGSAAGLLITGARERAGMERFVIVPGGIARTPVRTRADGKRPDTLFVRWGPSDACEIRRVSAYWKRLRIGVKAGPRGPVRATTFEAGFRCTDEQLEMVRVRLEEYLRASAG